MLGVPLEGSSRIMCDNQSVFVSSSFPESTLKNCLVAFHRVREYIAADKFVFYFEKTGSN